MKILIGTPVHELKDYAMARWLPNVAELREVYPADFLMVDNSPDASYVEKLKAYCQRYKIEDYQIKRLEIAQGETVPKSVAEQIHERVAKSQEIIRQFALEGGYAAWFSWECDQIIPPDTLNKLVEVMKLGNFIMVNHNIWDKNVPGGLCFDWGVTLVNRDYLKKYGFLLEYGTDPEPDSWYNAQAWYRQRLIRDKAPFIDLCGVISPVLHI